MRRLCAEGTARQCKGNASSSGTGQSKGTGLLGKGWAVRRRACHGKGIAELGIVSRGRRRERQGTARLRKGREKNVSDQQRLRKEGQYFARAKHSYEMQRQSRAMRIKAKCVDKERRLFGISEERRKK